MTLACPAGMSLTGPATLTCMGNGEWEPDPNKAECKNSSIIQIGRGSLSRDGKIAVASSVAVFALASIVFFTVGFLCGHFCQKKRKSNTSAAAAGESVPPVATDGEQTQIPYYDNVVLQQEAVELKDNVAYGPIQ